MKRRILCALTAALLLCTVIPFSASAEGMCGENVVWELSDNGVLTVSGTGNMADFDVGEAPWYGSRGTVRRLVVSEGVTAIGSGAFSGCGLIDEMSLPRSLTRIGDSAFDDTYALKSIRYAGSVSQWKSVYIGSGNSFTAAELVCADKTEPFSDISGWYHDFIITCYMADIINGCGDGTFRPELNVTRAQFVMILYNMGSRPSVSDAPLGFSDSVGISDAFVPAVKWGVKAGIVMGYGDNTFRPNENISRAQMAAFAYRFLKLGVSESTLDDLKYHNSFNDSGSIPDYFAEAVDVMANAGVINGYPNGNFDPAGTATRGQAAAVASRLLTALTELRAQ